VKNKYLALIGVGLVLFSTLYFFGQTIPPKKESPKQEANNEPSSTEGISFDQILAASKQKLSSNSYNEYSN